MRAGKLRHRITIEERLETQEATGEPVWEWVPFADVWASIEPISGREFFAAQQVQSTVSTRIRIRHLEGVTQKMRVNYNGRYYAIEAVIRVMERDREIHLMCVERDADGWRS